MIKRASTLATGRHLLMFTLVLGLSSSTTPRPLAQTLASIHREKVLHTFGNGKDGIFPGTMISDGAGKFYGTTIEGGLYGGGTVFQLTLGTNGRWTETILHSFNKKPYPGGLVLDAFGNLYGVTDDGGAYGGGSIFELMPGVDGKWTETVLHSFLSHREDGFSPNSPLIFDAAGNLYGTTFDGGDISLSGCKLGCGTVFELMPGANGKWTEKLLHVFHYGVKDGNHPAAGVIFDSAGNLYGTTRYGGRGGVGTVFELTPNKDGTWTQKLLHSFGGKDGDQPIDLIFDSVGNFYGTTYWGGAGCVGVSFGCGTVFELTPRTDGKWTESVLHSFGQGSDGVEPNASLVFGSAGNLYGETYGGGSGSGCAVQTGCGTVFQLTLGANNKWSEKILYNFCSASNCADGLDPSGLIFDGMSTLYGTTYDGGVVGGCGGYGCGVVFQLKP